MEEDQGDGAMMEVEEEEEGGEGETAASKVSAGYGMAWHGRERRLCGCLDIEKHSIPAFLFSLSLSDG